MLPKTLRLSVSQAVEGFLLAKAAEGCSPNTITGYRVCLGHHLGGWLENTGNTGATLDSLSAQDIRRFLVHLRAAPNGRGKPLSAKSVRNVHVALQSLYAWAHQEFDLPDPTSQVPAPKAPAPLIQPLTLDQVSAVLKACDASRAAQTHLRKSFTMARGTALRDRALVLALLDTGMRAGEVCRLAFADIDLASGQVAIRQAKCGSVRMVYMGKAARRALWRYVTSRGKHAPTDPVFVTRDGAPLTVDRLTKLFAHLGERAGFHVHPHQLRHTFATMFLRNGGNLLGLQRLLGHSSLEMVRRYASIAEADLAQAHQDASPADRWRL